MFCWDVKRIRWIYILIVNIPLHCFILCLVCFYFLLFFSVRKVDHDLLKVVALPLHEKTLSKERQKKKSTEKRNAVRQWSDSQSVYVTLSPTLSLFSLLFRKDERSREQPNTRGRSANVFKQNNGPFVTKYNLPMLFSALLLACEL